MGASFVNPDQSRTKMLFKAVVVGATLVTVAAAAVLPVVRRDDPVFNPDPSWPKPWRKDLLSANKSTPDAYIIANDDTWIKLDLDFPIKIFDKTSTTAYISVNGIFSIDEPVAGQPSVPEQKLPVDPAKCGTTPGAGCLPGTAIAAFWRDLQLTNTGAYGTGLGWQYTYHPGNETPHYHIYWFLCDKAVSMAPIGDTRCGKATRYIRMTFWQQNPGVFMFEYLMNDGSEGVDATMGVQSYPDYLSLTAAEVFEGRVCSLVYFDTNTRNTTIGPIDYC
ncbi:hypothetical protein Dda_3748 [Drechslerella dactyloides]|uniref:Uncharacterized protein n=1 Tax=Drechslerella dactyloides TaxID=74499 RepID=A0AAD6NLF2_DREDA|nr:hypothetical protein Dda_3748 [Drechslerella dactyloides]